MEHTVQQRSPAWFELRRKTVVTASNFGEVVGVGKGRPYDFLCSLMNEDSGVDDSSHLMQHGTEMEPVIHEAYGLLTDNKTRESGFWTLNDNQHPLNDLIGASPDAIVLDNTTDQHVGVCEFKAPYHRMYKSIPPRYMAQMQGQMAVTGLPWCDFMALCEASREIMLARVDFCQEYWDFVANRLQHFCYAFKEMKEGQSGKYTAMVKQWTATSDLECSRQVKVTNLLQQCDASGFCGPSGITLTFEILIGSQLESDHGNIAKGDFEVDISKLDEEIEEKLMNEELTRIGV